MRRSKTLGLLLAMVFGAISLVGLAPAAHADDSYTGTCSIFITPLEVAPGGTVTITAKGFNPGADVMFTVDSTTTIGTATADGDGTASITWTIPNDFVLGDHAIAAAGDGCTDPAQVEAEVTVVAAAAQTQTPTSGTLPRTGGDFSYLLRIGIVLVAAGALVVLATRKRASHSSSV
jgi:LPXTG-motif cell wall-anchored protein